MPSLALLSRIFCAILQRYRKMQQSSTPVPIERGPWNDLSKAPSSHEVSPQLLGQTGSKTDHFCHSILILKARSVPNPGDVPPATLGSCVQGIALRVFASLRDIWSLARVGHPDRDHAKTQKKGNGEMDFGPNAAITEPWHSPLYRNPFRFARRNKIILTAEQIISHRWTRMNTDKKNGPTSQQEITEETEKAENRHSPLFSLFAPVQVLRSLSVFHRCRPSVFVVNKLRESRTSQGRTSWDMLPRRCCRFRGRGEVCSIELLRSEFDLTRFPGLNSSYGKV